MSAKLGTKKGDAKGGLGFSVTMTLTEVNFNLCKPSKYYNDYILYIYVL